MIKPDRNLLLTGILSAILLCQAAFSQDVLGDRIGDLPPTTPASFALLDATVHTGTGEVLEKATILLRDGLIEAVGTDLNIPGDAWQIDLSGKQVYPGLIDAVWPLNRTEQARRRRGDNRTPSASSDKSPGLKSQIQVADSFQIDEKEKAGWRDQGILSLNLAPGEGIFQGQTALITLNDAESSGMILSSPVHMQLSLRSLSAPDYPASLMGVMAFINQTLFDARRYSEVHRRYSSDPRGLRRPETDLRLQALSPVISGATPLLFPAKRAHRIRQALRIAAEHQVKVVLVGGYEASSLAGEIKDAGIPVLVSLDYPEPPEERKKNPYVEDSFRDLKYRETARKTAALLKDEGVSFAFASAGPMKPADFLEGLRISIEHGLDSAAALTAVTQSAAEILGVGDRLGSIETGKIANLIVTDGDLFSKEAQVQFVFVDGERYLPRPELEDEDEENDEKETGR